MIDIDILRPGLTANPKHSKATPPTLKFGQNLEIDPEHIEHMRMLHNKNNLVLHPARTLDKYADTDLCDEWLDRYDLDQTLSRWVDKHHEEKNHDHGRHHNLNTLQERVTDRASAPRNWLQKAMTRSPSTAGTMAPDKEMQSPPETDTQSASDKKVKLPPKLSKEHNRLILVVSQLWLFKFDGESPFEGIGIGRGGWEVEKLC